MPRVTLSSLAQELEAERAEAARLRQVNERLQDAVLEQAERLRVLGEQQKKAAEARRERVLESHCPICCEPLTDLDAPLSCGHEFCRKCCQAHFAHKAACPVCRRDVTPKELWRFRHPRIARFWQCLNASAWPETGDIVVVTTRATTLAGLLLRTSEERASIFLMYGSSSWEVKLEDVVEIYTVQSLLEHLPPREDGMLRIVSNV